MTSTSIKKQARATQKDAGIPYTEALAKTIKEVFFNDEISTLSNDELIAYGKLLQGTQEWLKVGLAGPSGFDAIVRSTDGAATAGFQVVTDQNNDWSAFIQEIKEEIHTQKRFLESISESSPYFLKLSQELEELELELRGEEKLKDTILRVAPQKSLLPWYPDADEAELYGEDPIFDVYLPNSLKGVTHLAFFHYDSFSESVAEGWEPFVQKALNTLGGSLAYEDEIFVSQEVGKVSGYVGASIIFVRVDSLNTANDVLKKLGTVMVSGEDTGDGLKHFRS